MSRLAGTRREVADAYGISLDTLDNLVSRGAIPFVRLSPRVIRFPWHALDKWSLDTAMASLGQQP